MTNEQIKEMIEQGLPNSEAFVDGDGTHFIAQVICDAFAGQSPVKQHRMVYAAVGDNMKSAIHALSIQTYTREAWQAQLALARG